MYAPPYELTIPPMVSVWTNGIGWMSAVLSASRPSSATYESANGAGYFPILLPAPCVVRRVWWVNGSTTTGGATIEVGVYANASYAPAAKLVSGSATQGTASQVQFVDVTDTVLAAGLYWLALASSSATNTTLFRTNVNGYTDASWRYSEASAYPLPTTATAAAASYSNVWLFGFSTTASP